MKILIVSSYLPYPLDSGGHVRLFNILKELKKNHQISLVCEMRSYQTEKDILEVKKFCKEVITIPRKRQWSIGNIIKTGLSSYPFLLTGHTSRSMKKQIVQLLNNSRFDLIHVETFYVNQNIPKTYLPVVLVEHNVEYLVYERFAKTTPLFMKPFLYLDVAKIKYWEKKFWNLATKVVTVSEEERRIINRENTAVVPNGVDTKVFTFKKNIKRKEKRILFIGNFKWIQNINAATFIISEIWPILKNKENVKLWIVGKNIPDKIKSLTDDISVLFDENAPDQTWKIYKSADILLAPITVGGGTSYKILEAMASGVPVVTTKLGIEGLQAINKKHALVGETAHDLAKNVSLFLEDLTLVEKITQEARKFVEENYSWEKIANKLNNVYKSVI